MGALRLHAAAAHASTSMPGGLGARHGHACRRRASACASRRSTRPATSRGDRSRIHVDNTCSGEGRRGSRSKAERAGVGPTTSTVRWSNPPGQVAPIARARYRLCPAAAATCVDGSRRGHRTSTALRLSVPAPGEYTLRVWLEDAAGNHDPDRASDPVALRFDDEAPAAVFEATDPGDPLRGRRVRRGPRSWVSPRIHRGAPHGRARLAGPRRRGWRAGAWSRRSTTRAARRDLRVSRTRARRGGQRAHGRQARDGSPMRRLACLRAPRAQHRPGASGGVARGGAAGGRRVRERTPGRCAATAPRSTDCCEPAIDRCRAARSRC